VGGGGQRKKEVKTYWLKKFNLFRPKKRDLKKKKRKSIAKFPRGKTKGSRRKKKSSRQHKTKGKRTEREFCYSENVQRYGERFSGQKDLTQKDPLGQVRER